jgi:hypothetical protein
MAKSQTPLVVPITSQWGGKAKQVAVLLRRENNR